MDGNGNLPIINKVESKELFESSELNNLINVLFYSERF